MKPGKHALVILVTLIVLVACLLVPAITSQRALAATGWSSVGGKQPNCNLSYDTANGCIYSGYVGGVEKYDGTNWTDLGAPSGITNPEALCVCAMGDTVYAGFDDYFSSANEGIWYYYNGTWSNTDQGGTALGSLPNCMCYDGADNELDAGTQNGIWANDFDHTGWSQVALNGYNVSSLAYNSDSGVLYAGTYGGHGLWVDNGGTWTQLSGLASLSVTSLAFDGAYSMFAGTNNGVYWVFENGTYQLLGGPASAPAIACDTTHEIFYVGSSSSTVRSCTYDPTTAGTWGNTGGPNSNISAIAYDPVHNFIYAGSPTQTVVYRDGPLPAPTVSGITPSSGAVGTTVPITNLAGNNFQSGATVTFSKSGQNISAIGVSVSTSKITCSFPIPSGASPGNWDVVVTNPDTQSVTDAGAFRVHTPTHSITVTQGANGSITPEGTGGVVTVNDGADQAFTITPAAHYQVATLTVDGGSVTPATSYTFNNVTGDHKIAATFSMITHSITVTQGTNGTTTPAGTGGVVTVNDGADQAFTITPSAGYHVSDVVIDGTNHLGNVNSYTFHGVTAGHTISASFALGITHSITVTQGTNGTITPAGTGGVVTVNDGADQAFTITPSTGYHIGTLTVDGVAVTPATSYTFHGVTSDHTITATFAINPPPSTASTFYFAEGYTGTNFAEYLTLGNPNTAAATASVTYMFPDGTTKNASYSVPATGRTTVNVNSAVGPNQEVSIKVLSKTANLVAERPMYFNYNGVWTGGSDAVGATAPNKNWYFAEGNTLAGFDEYVTVLNPGGATANLTFHYMVAGQGEKDASGSVGAHSRATFTTRNQIGSGLNESLYLSSNEPVVAERPMYFNYGGLASDNWTGGHDVVGANAPQKQWYLAEGTTRAGFEEWLTLQNPASTAITVNATYQLGTGQGAPITKSYIVPAKQRLTVSVNQEIGPEKDDSVKLTSSSAFIAERPMYFSYHGLWTGGHDVLGANKSATNWFFAEGTTRDNFDEWLCMQNPGSKDAKVTITYYTTQGKAIPKNWTVSANTRLTVNVNQDAGANQDISAKVSSDNPIIVERPMYFDYNGVWTGGHDVVGFVPAQ